MWWAVWNILGPDYCTLDSQVKPIKICKSRCVLIFSFNTHAERGLAELETDNSQAPISLCDWGHNFFYWASVSYMENQIP
jgi:hypothetical protein